jgi:hypothetical protein
MKRILLALMVATAPAAWGETLAKTVEADAARIGQVVETARKAALAKPTLKPQALSPALVLDLQRFGLNASRLALEIDQGGGPADLGCIFRGMAEETDVQLKAVAAASTGAAQADALKRLSAMLRDANEIAPAVSLKPAKTIAADPGGSAAIGTCPAARS